MFFIVFIEFKIVMEFIRDFFNKELICSFIDVDCMKVCLFVFSVFVILNCLLYFIFDLIMCIKFCVFCIF